MPPFPLTLLAQGAAAHHELFRTYVEAGFSEDRAFQILLMIMWYGLLKMPDAPMPDTS